MKSYFFLWIIPGGMHGCFKAMNTCRVILVNRDNFLLSFLQHTASSLPTLKRAYASLAGGLRRYFKAQHGQNHSFSKQPLFPQDVEHLIDTFGKETPKQLQSKYWLHIFFLFIWIRCWRWNCNNTELFYSVMTNCGISLLLSIFFWFEDKWGSDHDVALFINAVSFCTLITPPVLSPPYPRISVVTWEPSYLRIPWYNDFRATKVARESSAFISVFYIHLLQFN